MMVRIQTFIFLISVLSVLASTVSFSADNQTVFFLGVEDLPVAPGLREIPDESLIYDTSAGRIVQAYAQGHLSSESILEFYRVTLPQLGWQALKKTKFRRETEILELKITRASGEARLSIRLNPVER